MAAGSGVTHSEFNPSSDQEVHLLQIWIKPNEKGVTPRYEERSMTEAPSDAMTLVASGDGRDASIRIHQDADLWLGKLSDGTRIDHKIADGRHVWLHVAEGSVEVLGETLRSGDAVGISDERELRIQVTERSQVLLFDLA